MRGVKAARKPWALRERDIPRTRFDGLVRELLRELKVCKIQAEAVDMLQKASEAYLAELFADANQIRRTTGRSEMHVRHLQCAHRLLERRGAAGV